MLKQSKEPGFLDRHGWSIDSPMAGDGSARRYFRVRKGDQSAVLMEVAGETPGHRLEDFVRIGEWLNSAGLRVPEIYEAEGDCLLLEDFGDVSFKQALAQGQDPQEIYGLAGDVLAHLAGQDCDLALPGFYDSHVYKAHRRVMDWYWPVLRQERVSDDLIAGYLAAWDEIEKELAPCSQGFLHIDFHVENLMWLPDEDGIRRCGILDFQGAMRGPLSYDLANLLEDMRVDVGPDLQAGFLKGRDQDFLDQYRVLATQFHCRLLGQCVRWAARDGKGQYLRYIPRVRRYVEKALEEPAMAPLAAFFSGAGLDFTGGKDLNAQEVMQYIREDAY